MVLFLTNSSTSEITTLLQQQYCTCVMSVHVLSSCHRIFDHMRCGRYYSRSVDHLDHWSVCTGTVMRNYVREKVADTKTQAWPL